MRAASRAAQAEPRAKKARTAGGRPDGKATAERQAGERRQQQQQAEAAELLARQQAELAAGRRARIEEAERAVTAAAATASDAAATEDGLEAEVRDLEGRLERARADLAVARRRARQAEAAERRARQALDRNPAP